MDEFDDHWRPQWLHCHVCEWNYQFPGFKKTRTVSKVISTHIHIQMYRSYRNHCGRQSVHRAIVEHHAPDPAMEQQQQASGARPEQESPRERREQKEQHRCLLVRTGTQTAGSVAQALPHGL